MVIKKFPFTLAAVSLLATVSLSHAIELPPGPSPSPTPVVRAPTPTPVPTPRTVSKTDEDAIVSALQSGVPLTDAQRQLLTTISQTVLQDINARLFRLRAGVTLRDDGSVGAGGPTGGKEIKDSKTVEVPFKRWEIFAAGNFGNFDLNDEGNHPGYESNTWVGTLGAEYHVNEVLSFGLAGSWIESGADLSRKIGSVDTSGLALSAYGSAVVDNFYVDLLYSFGTLEQDTHRNTFTGRTAHGENSAVTNAIQFNTGYTFKFGQFHTGPLASLNWIHGDLDGYHETGGGSANLAVPNAHTDSLISQFGWQASYVAPTGFGLLIPQIRASWDHEYLDDADSASASLLDSPFSTVTGSNVSQGGKFTATGRSANPGSDYLNLGVGVSARFGDRVSMTMDYQTHLFQERASAHFASIKFVFSF